MTPLEQIKKIEGNNTQIFPVNENRVLVFKREEETLMNVLEPSDQVGLTTSTISEYFFNNSRIKKYYRLIQWDDYGFESWTNDDVLIKQKVDKSSNTKVINTISFEFDIDHPLYMHLFHLLNYEEELLIDDDRSESTIPEHRINIRRSRNKIIVDFIDNTHYNESTIILRRFFIFVKNVMPDARSRMSDETKIRLADFFIDAFQISNVERQYTIEEEILRKGSDDDIKMLEKVYKIIPRQKH